MEESAELDSLHNELDISEITSSSHKAYAEDEKTNDSNYNCTLCQKTFKSRSGLYKHKQKAHEVLKGVPCHEENCTFTTSKAFLLREHLMKSHNKQMNIEEITFKNMQGTIAKSDVDFISCFHHRINVVEINI
jgi:uncharacterized C2H2 Zn-finger protein